MDNKPFHAFIDEYIDAFVSKHINDFKSSDLHAKIIAQVEKSLIKSVLTATKNNQSKAASVLGISRVTLRHKILSLNIPLDVPDVS
jgi:two-component system nitrogen regulation response regulator GlnG